MAELQPSDQFLVNRDGASYNVTQANLMAQIQDTDLMLVNRDDASYKITGAEVKDSFVEPIEISGIILTTLDPMVGQEISVIVNATGGKSPVETYQWRRDTVNITLNGTSVTYIPVEADVGASLDCVVTITDTVADTVTATSDSTNAVKPDETVNAPTLLTPPNGAGLGPAVVTPTTDTVSTVSTTDTTTTVVVSGTKDLNLLEEGSATMTDATGIVANYTPVTSNITTIEGGATVFTVTNWGSPGNAIDGSTLTQASSANLGGNSSAFGVIDFGGTINITKFEFYGRIYTSNNRYQLLDAAGTAVHNLTDVAEDRNYGWKTIYDGVALSASSYRAHVYVDSLTQYTSDDIYAIKINGETIACTDIVTVSELLATGNNSSADTILTFTDNQDLTYFQPGDAVQDTATVVSVDVANKKMTVDGGNWALYNSSQTWSDDLSPITEGYPAVDAFDGNPDTAGGVVACGGAWTMTWTPSFTVPNGSTFKGKLNMGDGDRNVAINVDVDGVTTVLRESAPGYPPFEYDLYTNNTGSPVTLSNFSMVNTGTAGQTGVTTIYWLAVDNTIFVDNVPASGPVVGEGKVTGPETTGTGRVSTVDQGSKTITVTDSNKRWVSSGAWNTSTLQGNAAGTNFYLSGDEVHTVQINGSDFNMTCTEFSGSGDPTYATTTWQVTTDADTDFANPVVNVTNTNETLYNVTTLDAEVIYRARVRQTSTEGTESHFSDVNRFKTTTPISENQIATNTYTGGDNFLYLGKKKINFIKIK